MRARLASAHCVPEPFHLWRFFCQRIFAAPCPGAASFFSALFFSSLLWQRLFPDFSVQLVQLIYCHLQALQLCLSLSQLLFGRLCGAFLEWAWAAFCSACWLARRDCAPWPLLPDAASGYFGSSISRSSLRLFNAAASSCRPSCSASLVTWAIWRSRRASASAIRSVSRSHSPSSIRRFCTTAACSASAFRRQQACGQFCPTGHSQSDGCVFNFCCCLLAQCRLFCFLLPDVAIWQGQAVLQLCEYGQPPTDNGQLDEPVWPVAGVVRPAGQSYPQCALDYFRYCANAACPGGGADASP